MDGLWVGVQPARCFGASSGSSDDSQLIRAAARKFRQSRILPFCVLALLAGVARGQTPNLVAGNLPDSALTTSDVANIDLAASHIANRIREANLTERHPTVFVLDFFRDSPGTSSALGTLLADQFSSSLATLAQDFGVLDRKVVKDYLAKNWVTLEELRSREVCLGLARDMGATGVIMGSIYMENGLIAITIHLEGFGPRKKDENELVSSDEISRIGASPPIKDLLFQSGPNYFRTADDIPAEAGVFQPGAEGVGLPTCVYCPDPQYSDAARVAKFQGSIQLSVVVTENGAATSIYVLKGGPLGLTAQAIKAVHSWKFRPAQKDGKPVAVRVPIEVSFRLF